jgi:FkbM family methyltransferase
MVKKIAFIFYKIIFGLDAIFNKITKRSVLIWFTEFIQNDSYKKIKIFKSDIIFFIPNSITKWRVDNLFTLEPETLDWISGFNKKDKIIFWDIGANIGLYSIYNSLKNTNSQTISFEPSTSNLRVLSRNISINNLQNKIKIFPIALTNKKNKFLFMKEGQFIEGGALNSFGENYNFEGKNFISKMNYTTFGTNINFLIDNNILEIPDYIKIDVDGIEHLILEGGDKYLRNKKIKSISIEINENFFEQYKKVLNIMKMSKFKMLHKKQNENVFNRDRKNKFSKTFNYIFQK